MNQHRLRQLLTYDPKTGLFSSAASGHGLYRGDERGSTVRSGYLRVIVDGAGHFAHRLAWLYMTGGWPVNEIDHINGCKADNRWANLRDVTHAENMQNVVAPNKNSKSGVRGVSWSEQNRGWMAQIMANGKRRTLGFFPTVDEAGEAYRTAKAASHACPQMVTEAGF